MTILESREQMFSPLQIFSLWGLRYGYICFFVCAQFTFVFFVPGKLPPPGPTAYPQASERAAAPQSYAGSKAQRHPGNIARVCQAAAPRGYAKAPGSQPPRGYARELEGTH